MRWRPPPNRAPLLPEVVSGQVTRDGAYLGATPRKTGSPAEARQRWLSNHVPRLLLSDVLVQPRSQGADADHIRTPPSRSSSLASTSPTTSSPGRRTIPCSMMRRSSRAGRPTSRATPTRRSSGGDTSWPAPPITASSSTATSSSAGAYTGVGVKTVVDYLGRYRVSKDILGLRFVRARRSDAASFRCPSTARCSKGACARNSRPIRR